MQEEYVKNKNEFENLIKKIEQQNTIIKELDNERDEFQMEVDKKTEKIVELESKNFKLNNDRKNYLNI